MIRRFPLLLLIFIPSSFSFLQSLLCPCNRNQCQQVILRIDQKSSRVPENDNNSNGCSNGNNYINSSIIAPFQFQSSLPLCQSHCASSCGGGGGQPVYPTQPSYGGGYGSAFGASSVIFDLSDLSLTLGKLPTMAFY